MTIPNNATIHLDIDFRNRRPVTAVITVCEFRGRIIDTIVMDAEQLAAFVPGLNLWQDGAVMETAVVPAGGVGR